jgi:hypothetical protein
MTPASARLTSRDSAVNYQRRVHGAKPAFRAAGVGTVERTVVEEARWNAVLRPRVRATGTAPR